MDSAVGEQLLNTSLGTSIELTYWRDRNQAVDFVLRSGAKITAIEVKSGRRREPPPGLGAFDKRFRPQHKLLVGGQGVLIEEFLVKPAAHWLA